MPELKGRGSEEHESFFQTEKKTEMFLWNFHVWKILNVFQKALNKVKQEIKNEQQYRIHFKAFEN